MPRSAYLRISLAAMLALLAAAGTTVAWAQSADDSERSGQRDAQSRPPLLIPDLEDLRREIDPEREPDPFTRDRDAEDESDDRRRDELQQDNAERQPDAEPGERREDQEDTETAERQGESALSRQLPDRDGTDPEEELDRVDDRVRPEEENPYDPVGYRLGSFIILPDLRVEQLFSSNALQSSTNAQPDRAIVVTRDLTIRSDWSRHALEGTINILRSYYSEFDRQNDETNSAALLGRLDVSRSTFVEGTVRYSDSLEDSSSNETPAGAAERTPVIEQGATLALSRRFNRVTALLRGGISEIDYEDVPLVGGGTANNDDRDFTERELTARLSYEFRPGVSGFLEGSGNDRMFDSIVDDNGLRRDSAGFTTLAGVALDFGSRLSGEISAGFARQSPVDVALEDVSGLIFNAGLEWRITPLTTIRLEATSEVEETTAANSAGAIQRTAELSIEHAFRQNLIAGVSFGYEEEDFSGSGQLDQDYFIGVTGEYFITRSIGLTASYDFNRSVRSTPGNDYIENEVRVGLRFRR